MKPKRKIISLLLCAAMLLSLCPTSVFAEAAAQDSGITIGASGLCEHHTKHDEGCGYTEGTPESPCNHEHKVNGGEADREGGLGHTEDCYTLVKNCVHSHTEDCYPQETVSGNVAAPSDGEEREPENCAHVCSEESGCIVEELDCQHEHKVNGGEADREGGLGHDDQCGYAPATEGTPCGFVCEECNPVDSGDPAAIAVPSNAVMPIGTDTTFATVEELKKFNTNDNDGETNPAKVYFGGTEDNPQQWWIAGSQSQDSMTLFAASPLEASQQFEPNGGTNKTYSDDWECDYTSIGGAAPTDVYPSHYGASPLRNTLKGLETSYFSGEEQKLMNDTTVYTYDKKIVLPILQPINCILPMGILMTTSILQLEQTRQII